MERHSALTATLVAVVLLILLAIPVVPWVVSSRSPEAPEAAPEPVVEVVRAGQPVLGSAGERAPARPRAQRSKPGTASMAVTIPVIEISIEARDDLRRGSVAAAAGAASDAIALTADGHVSVSEGLERALRRGRLTAPVVALGDVSALEDLHAIVLEHVSYAGRGRSGSLHRALVAGGSTLVMPYAAPAALRVEDDQALMDIIPWPDGAWSVNDGWLEVATASGSVRVAAGESVTIGPFDAGVTLRSQQAGVEVVRGQVAFSATATVTFHGRLPVRVE